jgi:hypothetical protein
MKPSISLRDLLGWIAVVGMLALSSLGVTIVRAEGEGQASPVSPPPGPTCQAGAETGHAARRTLSVDLSELVAQRAPGSPAGVVALETGGYGYAEEPAAGPGDASVSIVVVPAD